jgi:hypothetical protein
MEANTGIAARKAGTAGSAPPRVGGYRTERLLGAGAHGTVWLVRADVGGGLFALKVAALPGDPASGDPADIRRELRILQHYRHEHLLAVRDVVSTDCGPGLLLEYAAGGSLLALVAARGPLAIGEAVTILAPVAQALACLHGEGAAHGDVSPGNILFTAEGKPLLADLGVARLLGEPGAGVTGTPGFTAPSGARGDSSAALGADGDVHSLCAVGWYALTGRVPGPAAQRPPLSLLVPGVPGELLELLEAGLDANPARRPAAREFARAVLRAAAPEPVDLLPAVHSSVLPQLRTRRAAASAVRRQGIGLRLLGQIRRPALHRRPPSTRMVVLVVLSLAAAGVALAAVAGSPSAGQPPLAKETQAKETSATMTGGNLSTSAQTGRGAEGAVESAPSGTGGHATGTGGPGTVPSARQARLLSGPSPAGAVRVLAGLRAAAFSSGDPALLARVNAQGSPAMATDRAALRVLARRGHILSGLTVRLQNVRATRLPPGAGSDTDTRRAIAATAVMSGYAEQDASGAVVRREARIRTQHLIFVLTSADGSWKLVSTHRQKRKS